MSRAPESRRQTAPLPTSSVRRALRTVFVEMVALLPVPFKERLFLSLRRPLLAILFRLERQPEVVTRAGPAGHRFPMRLVWQAHTTYILGIYEPAVVRALRRCVQPGGLCVDVGAHLGYFTILMARFAGPSGRVIAFEPFPDTYRALEQNIGLNQIRNVVLEPRAVSESSGTLSLTFARTQRYSWTPSAVAYAVEGETAVMDVPVTSLDDYFRQFPGSPRVVKIDVEGAEFSVLRGAAETLSRARPVVFVEVHGRDTAQLDRIRSFLTGLGYQVSLLGTREREAFCLALPANPDEAAINP